MAKDLIDAVEIVEPPIGELTKQRSSFKRTCLTGCGCVVFLVGVVVVGIKIFIGSGPSTIRTLPTNFPNSIPLYEKDSIERMTFISGKYKDRSMEIAALFPKVILSPILLTIHRGEVTTSTPNDNFWKILTTPVGDTRDTIQIEWRNMDAEPSYVLSYYRKELSKRGYTFSNEIGGDNVYSLNFAREDDIAGYLYATGQVEDHPGTDYASLTINIPSNYQNPSTTLK